jgi:splicing factor 3A subunit 1
MSTADVIYPPADIKSVIDKTAEFVAKVGEDFERKVASQQAGQPKFAFLNPGNPYRKYYELRVKELKEGKEASAPSIPKALQDMREAEEEKKKKRAERKMIADGLVKEYPAPPPSMYIVERPFAAPVDIDIMQVTAQFVARNGNKFLEGLLSRENRNPQFEFLISEHHFYSYFQQLVESYTKVLMVPAEEKEKLKQLSESREAVLDRIRNRYLYLAQEEKRRSDKAKDEEERKEAMSRIDWFNFVIVGTLDFPEDETIRLEVPIDPRTGTRFSYGMPVPLEGLVITSEAHQKQIEEPEQEEEEIMMEEETPTIIPSSVQIRTDYVRTRKTDKPEPFIKCPITGEMVKESEFSEHMRVVLLDPQWKKQSEIVMKRAREEASALAEDIGENIADFIKKRLQEQTSEVASKRSRLDQ